MGIAGPLEVEAVADTAMRLAASGGRMGVEGTLARLGRCASRGSSLTTGLSSSALRLAAAASSCKDRVADERPSLGTGNWHGHVEGLRMPVRRLELSVGGRALPVLSYSTHSPHLLSRRLVIRGHASEELIDALYGQSLRLIYRAPVIVNLHHSTKASAALCHSQHCRLCRRQTHPAIRAFMPLLVCHGSALRGGITSPRENKSGVCAQRRADMVRCTCMPLAFTSVSSLLSQ